VATVVKTGGTVTSCAHAGSAYSATVDFGTNPSPPPPKIIVVFNSDGYHDDFLAALSGTNLVVDVTYEDTTNVPSSVTVRK